MPGGSVNGRPFREDPTSYAASGVPRGNPSRVHHPGVLRMGSSLAGNLVAPEEKIETEGEKQLKFLAKKQVATDITVEEHLKQKKVFTTGVLYKPLVQDVQGQLSLKDYEELAEKDRHIEELRQCGLTEEELELKLSCQIPEKKRRVGVDPAVQAMRMKDIDAKISEKQQLLSKQDEFSGIKKLSRHEYDLERSLLGSGNGGSQKIFSKLTKRVTREEHETNLWPENLPICSKKSSGSEKEENDSGSVDESGLKISNVEKSGAEARSPEEVKMIAKFCLKCNRIFKSETDIKICDECVKNCCTDVREDMEDGPAALCGPIRTVSEEDIKKNRLSVEEIKDLPRFKDYAPGVKNKVLYLKNLASGVSEFDLVSLFNRFQRRNGPKITYRLMSGRMKGQAFVTLENEETAAKALDLLNGYKLMGKPLVIQYGKKTAADKG